MTSPRRNRSKTSARPLRVAGLFAGIGGIETGLHQAGHSTSLLCEIDPPAVAVLEDRFPGVELHHDVTKLPDVGDVDLVAAGFPCQDLSQAGKTEGMNGNKSSLVLHVFRLLEKRRVPWVLLENVPFMLQLAKGHALDYVVTSLERLGYKWAYRVVDSRAFGLPQRRERVYLVASLDEDPRKVLFAGDQVPRDAAAKGERTAYGFYWTEGSRGLGWAVNAVPTLKGGSTVGIPSPPAIWLPTGEIVQPNIRDAERMQGFPADWTLSAEEVAKPGMRWKLVGNAVTVNAAAWLGERLRELDGRTDLPGTPVKADRSWPRAAWNVGEGRYSAPLSTWPVSIRGTPLAEFLEYEARALSARATAGFLSRFVTSYLTKPSGFVEALEAHLERMQAGGDHASPPKRAARPKRSYSAV